jgi:CBS domain-containing protein
MRDAWRGWAARLILVQPDTVVRWHRDRFRRHWSKLSRQDPGPGRPRVDKQLRDLIHRMRLESDWGAPRIHGELLKLGFTVSEATVSRYMPQRHIRHLPVVLERRLVGIISIGDVVKGVIEDQRFAINELQHYIMGER